MAFTVTSAFGTLSWKNSKRNDGTAIVTRMRTGTTVHNTSMVVLWVVREGTGLLRELNFTITVISSANTKSVIAEITHNRKSWNQMMSFITGVAPFCMPSCHGSGWPDAASATSAVMRGTLVPMNVINRLSTSIVQCAPSTKNGLAQAPSCRPPQA